MVRAVHSRPFRWTCSRLYKITLFVLARHCGFIEAEPDFIINYDIKYRMGRDAEGEDE